MNNEHVFFAQYRKARILEVITAMLEDALQRNNRPVSVEVHASLVQPIAREALQTTGAPAKSTVYFPIMLGSVPVSVNYSLVTVLVRINGSRITEELSI